MNLEHPPTLEDFLHRVRARTAKVGVIGLGYVGLPLSLTFCTRGFSVVGFDIDSSKISLLRGGDSYIKHLPHELIQPFLAAGQLTVSDDFALLTDCDAVLVCVPTPLNRNREPDIAFVKATTLTIAKHLRQGQLVVLESSTYPGTTDELMRGLLEASGVHRAGDDFWLAFSPEREDPGNPDFTTQRIPKVVGADDSASSAAAVALYAAAFDTVVPVPSTRVAEAVKLLENIFRAVNVGLVNELKIILERMGIDIWDVIAAAKTKPFGFMPFYPGPGLGGHCIPIDPFYLTWKAREFEVNTRLIELAGEINTDMPRYVVSRTVEALSRRSAKALNGSRVLLLGMSYKKNIDDIRESPALKVLDLLEDGGASVDYHDPFVAEIPRTREYGKYQGKRSQSIEAATLATYDAVIIVTDHDDVDYAMVVDNSRIVVDTRNAIRSRRPGVTPENLILA